MVFRTAMTDVTVAAARGGATAAATGAGTAEAAAGAVAGVAAVAAQAAAGEVAAAAAAPAHAPLQVCRRVRFRHTFDICRLDYCEVCQLYITICFLCFTVTLCWN